MTHPAISTFSTLLFPFFLGVTLLLSAPARAEGITEAVPAVEAEAETSPVAVDRALGLRPGIRLLFSLELAGEFEIEGFSFTIGPDGTAVLPLIDEVDFRGRTVKEASRALLEQYRKFYVPVPRIMLRLAEGQDDTGIWGHVTVLGRVTNPGRVVLTATRAISLSEAIARVGGFASSAKLGAIQIVRRQDGTSKSTVVDLNDTEAGPGSAYDVILRHGDVVQVPERMF